MKFNYRGREDIGLQLSDILMKHGVKDYDKRYSARKIMEDLIKLGRLKK